MRKFVVLIALLLGMALVSLGQNQQLQIMSYNVRHCEGMDMVVDYDRTASVIVQQHPDVVALQELDSMTGRSAIRSLGLPSNSTAACMVWASSLARCQ